MDPIQVTVWYPGASSVAAILLGAAGNVIRLAIDGWADAAEFSLVNGQWLSEDNELVEIESKPESPRAGSYRWITRPVHGNSPMPSMHVWVN